MQCWWSHCQHRGEKTRTNTQRPNVLHDWSSWICPIFTPILPLGVPSYLTIFIGFHPIWNLKPSTTAGVLPGIPSCKIHHPSNQEVEEKAGSEAFAKRNCSQPTFPPKPTDLWVKEYYEYYKIHAWMVDFYGKCIYIYIHQPFVLGKQ